VSKKGTLSPRQRRALQVGDVRKGAKHRRVYAALVKLLRSAA